MLTWMFFFQSTKTKKTVVNGSKCIHVSALWYVYLTWAMVKHHLTYDHLGWWVPSRATGHLTESSQKQPLSIWITGFLNGNSLSLQWNFSKISMPLQIHLKRIYIYIYILYEVRIIFQGRGFKMFKKILLLSRTATFLVRLRIHDAQCLRIWLINMWPTFCERILRPRCAWFGCIE